MRVNIHSHVFTFKTFLTGAAEADLKARLMARFPGRVYADVSS